MGLAEPAMAWWLGILTAAGGLVGVVVCAWVVVAGTPRAKRAREERRRRYQLPESDQRVGLIEADADARRAPTMLEALRSELSPGVAHAAPRPMAAEPPQVPVLGRFVQTPEGEELLTTPPFAPRESMLGKRAGRYVNRLALRVPAWVAVCPKVRLDSLVAPTNPEGRDAEDWRRWRKRVRLRYVDVVIVDRRSWRVLLAIVFEHSRRKPASRSLAGEQDRIIDEVLGGAGVPMLRVSGSFRRDWDAIRPYVEQAILPSVDEETRLKDAPRSEPVGPEQGVNLLRLDEEKGWILG